MNDLIGEQTQEELTCRLKPPKLVLQKGMPKTMTLTQLIKNKFFKIPSNSSAQYWTHIMEVERFGRSYILTIMYKQTGKNKAVCMGRLRYTANIHEALKCHT